MRNAFLVVLIILAEIRGLITGVTSRVTSSVWCWYAFVHVVVNLRRNNFAPIVPLIRRICPEFIEQFCHYYRFVHVVDLTPLEFLFGLVLESIQEIKQQVITCQARNLECKLRELFHIILNRGSLFQLPQPPTGLMDNLLQVKTDACVLP